MATKTLQENIGQATSDFNSIKQAIIDKGVEVPTGTPTNEYATKIGDIQSGEELMQLFSDVISRDVVDFNPPDGITKLWDGCLYYCDKLESITIPSTVTNVGNIYYSSKTYGRTIKKIKVLSNDITFKEQWVNSSMSTNIKTAGIIGSGCDYEFCWTEKIPNYALAYQKNLNEINFPDTITEICNGAFIGCTSLTEVTLPQNLIKLSGFHGCSNITEIEIPNTVTEIGVYAFSDCKCESLVIPKNVKSIGERAFQNFKSLKNLKFECDILSSGFNYYGFNSADNLESVEFENIYLPTDYTKDIFNNLIINTDKKVNLKNVRVNGTIYMTENYSFFSSYTSLTVDSLVSILNALEDNTGKTTYTVTLGATNLAKLTDEQKQIAIDKNYTLA